jgi:hypothetical protein
MVISPAGAVFVPYLPERRILRTLPAEKELAASVAEPTPVGIRLVSDVVFATVLSAVPEKTTPPGRVE